MAEDGDYDPVTMILIIHPRRTMAMAITMKPSGTKPPSGPMMMRTMRMRTMTCQQRGNMRRPSWLLMSNRPPGCPPGTALLIPYSIIFMF